MNEFKELDPAMQLLPNGKWYVSEKPQRCMYLHEDLNLHPETKNSTTDEYSGLWENELGAVCACRQYYLMHGRKFPYEGRFKELFNAGSTTNTTSCESQQMSFS